jgi:hypothetical protein
MKLIFQLWTLLSLLFGNGMGAMSGYRDFGGFFRAKEDMRRRQERIKAGFLADVDNEDPFKP